MSWFETALEMVTRTTIEVTVKNTLGQIAKEFYGHGPRVPVRCLVAGPLILHVVRPEGSIILDELAARPAGQVVMHYNNQLLVDRYREQLAQLARLALRTEMRLLFCDYDSAAQQIVGGALLGRALDQGARPAPAALAQALAGVAAAFGHTGTAEAKVGPGCFWAVLAAPGWVPGAEEAAPVGSSRAENPESLVAMIAWREWHGRVTARLRAAVADAGLRPEALFVGLDSGRLILGGLLPA